MDQSDYGLPENPFQEAEGQEAWPFRCVGCGRKWGYIPKYAPGNLQYCCYPGSIIHVSLTLNKEALNEAIDARKLSGGPAITMDDVIDFHKEMKGWGGDIYGTDKP